MQVLNTATADPSTKLFRPDWAFCCSWDMWDISIWWNDATGKKNHVDLCCSLAHCSRNVLQQTHWTAGWCWNMSVCTLELYFRKSRSKILQKTDVTTKHTGLGHVVQLPHTATSYWTYCPVSLPCVLYYINSSFWQYPTSSAHLCQLFAFISLLLPENPSLHCE